MATLDRRSLLTAAPFGLLSACQARTPLARSATSEIDVSTLEAEVTAIAADARPGVLGVGLMDLQNGQSYFLNPDRSFAMQSVFKLPLGAAVLSEWDDARLTLDERFAIDENQLSPQHSPIASAWPGRNIYTTSELLEAVLVHSDNTAADVLLKRIGGPGALTSWLESRGVEGVRVDRYERELQTEVNGMGTFAAEWRDEAVFNAVRSRLPDSRRLAAMRAHMADGRDSATPRGMLMFLHQLDRGLLISEVSSQRLRGLMLRTTSAPGRLRAGLPTDAILAHRTGYSGFNLGLMPACNDVGFFTLANGRRFAVAAFLSGSTVDLAASESRIARVAAAAVRAIR